jgi:hypothetical protein
VLWIGFNADPEPGSRTNADQDPGPSQTLKKQKVEFLHEKYTSSRNRSKIITSTYEGRKVFLKV